MINILITGKPGIGKTTLVKKVVSSLRKEGKKLGGFYTEEIREGHNRVGFKVVTLDGREGILSHKDLKSPFRVGKYRVNIKDLEEVATLSLEAAVHQADVVLIDEIAKMELFSDRFKEATLGALDSPKDVIATLQEKSNPFVNKIKKRTDIEILTLTSENRDNLVNTVIGCL